MIFSASNFKEVLGSKWKKWLLAIVIVVILRITFIWSMGLMPQDAYYNFYGEHLALSYFDHPPVIGYQLRFFTEMLGKKVSTIKLANSIVTLLTFLVFYQLSLCFLSKRRSLAACILLFSTLMISTLSLVSTPDVPLLLFWSLSLLMLYWAIFKGKSWAWLLAGLSMGLSFDSKYTGLFLPAGLILFLLVSNQYRFFLRNTWFWGSMGLFVLIISPVIIWNGQHEFASFLFQTSDRVNQTKNLNFKLSGFVGLLAHQSAILMPVLFVVLFNLVFKFIRRCFVHGKRCTPEFLFLISFFGPLFLMFSTLSFFYWIKLNWIMPAYISGILLVSVYFSKKLLCYQLWFSLLIHIAVSVEIMFYPFPVYSDDTWFGWDELSTQITLILKRYPGSIVFSADEYKTSAVLNFYSDTLVFGRNLIGEPALQFDYIGTDLTLLSGKNALYINSLPGLKDPDPQNRHPAALKSFFRSVSELDPIIIRNRGKPVRKFLVFYCQNYQPKLIIQ